MSTVAIIVIYVALVLVLFLGLLDLGSKLK